MVTATFLLAVVYLLPAGIPSVLGWLTMVLPLPVFYYLTVLGPSRCGILFRNSLILAASFALVTQMVYSFLFSLTMAPLGYSLYRSVKNGDDYSVAGLKGLVVLGVIWGGFWLMVGIGQEINPYRELLKILDQAFAQAAQVYVARPDIPVETGMQMERAVRMLRETVPVILPGILSSGLVFIVWLNVVLANRILYNRVPLPLQGDRFDAPWPPYSRWRLPEKLVWLVIGAGIAVTVGTGVLRQVGINMLMVLGLVYFFQGLAIMIYFLEKWAVPRFLKITLYVLLALQSYGLLILVLLGLADVWLDIRKLDTTRQAS